MRPRAHPWLPWASVSRCIKGQTFAHEARDTHGHFSGGGGSGVGPRRERRPSKARPMRPLELMLLVPLQLRGRCCLGSEAQLLLAHCRTSSPRPSPPFSLQWMRTEHLAQSLGPSGPPGDAVSSYSRPPKGARDGFTWDQITHMCFCCAPFYLNGICQKLSEGTTISLNWKNLGHTVETLATSSKTMGGGEWEVPGCHIPSTSGVVS